VFPEGETDASFTADEDLVRLISSPIYLKPTGYARFYMTDKRLVLTTCGSLEEARSIAHTLVERQLAACVNIAPQIESVYRWQGEVETATEWLLVIKTTAGAFNQLSEVLSELHSHELPECIEIAIENGSATYLEWIGTSVR
jgi:periplasmic divalent cation tolerance protein